MAKKTYGAMFKKIVRKVGLTNEFDDGTDETASIKEDINDIQKQVLSISKTYLKKAGALISGGTVATQAEYDIPEIVDKVSFVKVTVDSEYYYPEQISIQDFNNLVNIDQSSDIPEYWTIDKTKLVLYPTPVSNSLPIELNANVYSTDLNIDPDVSTDETTELEIKEGYENVIYYYCLTEAYERQEDTTLGDRQNEKYKEMMKTYKDEVKNSTNSVVVKHRGNKIFNRDVTLTN